MSQSDGGSVPRGQVLHLELRDASPGRDRNDEGSELTEIPKVKALTPFTVVQVCHLWMEAEPKHLQVRTACIQDRDE